MSNINICLFPYNNIGFLNVKAKCHPVNGGAASWITIKSNVCEMFPFDFSKWFSDLLENRDGGRMSGFPRYLAWRWRLWSSSISSRQLRDAAIAARIGSTQLSHDGNYRHNITQYEREPWRGRLWWRGLTFRKKICVGTHCSSWVGGLGDIGCFNDPYSS